MEGGRAPRERSQARSRTEVPRVREPAPAGVDEFRAFFDVNWIGMAQADLTGRLMRVNPGLCQITGYEEWELVGRFFSEITHPEDRERDRENFLRFSSGAAPLFQSEKRYVRKDGTIVWVQVTANLVRNRHGHACRTAAVIQEITARKAAEAAQQEALQALATSERQHRILARVSQLAAETSDAGDLIEAVGECVATELQVSRCGFAVIDHENNRVTVTRAFHTATVSPLTGTFPLDEYTQYYWEDAQAGRVATVEDAATDPRTASFYAARFEPIQLRAHFTVPLHRGGRWVAGFWATHHEPRRWTPAEIETMRLVAERVWTATERQRAAEELRASEQRFRSVLENMSEGVMLFDPNQDLIFQNPASLQIHGFDRDDPGRLSHEKVPVTWKAWDENDRPITFEEWPVSRVFRLERFQNQVLRVVRVETGQEFYGSYNGSPICDPAGRLVLGFITIRDITQQVKARLALKENQRRLQAFFESPMMGAIYWNMDGAITDANGRFLEMVGYTREELLSGQVSWDAMTPSEYRAVDEFALQELRTTGIDTPYEKEYIRKDGSRVAILIGAAMLDERRHDGVAFVLDLSARKQAEDAARASEQQFRALAESIPNLAWWAHPDGSIPWYNQRWYAYTGTTLEEMQGWGWQSVHDPAYLPQVLEKWQAALGSGAPFEMEMPLRGADGAFRWFLTRVVPVKDARGKIQRWFGTNTDISTLREARDALARHKEQLENLVVERTARLQEVVNELSAFSYSVSHDLRSPLRTISGFADILRTDHAAKLDADGGALLERIVRATGRMNAMITDLLEYSQVTRSELHIEPIDPEPLLREIVDANAASASAATVEVRGPFPRVQASRIALAQCLSNLVVNALKFSRPGVPLRVTIGAETRPGFVRLFVRDNGIGIAAEHQARVWGMFERLNPDYTGTGIGLAIVRRAVERMGGEVGLESFPGEGSKFWVELPAA